MRSATGSRLLHLGAWSLLALIPVFFATHSPLSPDESLPYQNLTCPRFPGRTETSLPGVCGFYDLKLFGKWLPLRNYNYAGSVSQLLYWPVFRIWPNYLSARLTAIVSLTLLSLLIADLTGAGVAIAFGLVFLNLPLVFQHTIDTGPIAAQTVIMLALPWLYWRRRTKLSAIFAGILLFAAIDNKPVFLSVVPGILLLCAAKRARRPSGRPVAAEWAYPALAGAVAALLCGILLSATSRTGHSYFYDLRRMSLEKPFGPASDSFHAFRRLAPYLLNFESFLHRVYPIQEGVHPTWPRPGVGLATLFFWITSALWGFHAWRLARRSGRESPAGGARERLRLAAFSLGAFALTEACLVQTPLAWAGHHWVLAMPFLLVALASVAAILRSNRQSLGLAAGFVVFAIGVVAPMRELGDPRIQARKEYTLRIHDELNMPEIRDRSIIVTLDDGLRYTQQLYGDPRQVIVPLRRSGESYELEEVSRLRSLTGRKLAFVVLTPLSEPTRRLLGRVPGVAPVGTAMEPDGMGRYWALWKEP